MKNSISFLASALSLLAPALTRPTAQDVQARQDTSKVGYLYADWRTANESVYFSLSTNDDPFNFKPVNGNNPVLIPTLGTKALRDTSIITGVGDDAGKFYIIGTDLEIDVTNWDEAQRSGSKSIFVWESTDLVTWTDARLVRVESDLAGMTWAPDAIWDPAQNQYMVHWASRLYSEDDPEHTGESVTPAIMRYAHTSDFQTFTEPQTYINKGYDTIDLSFLHSGGDTFVRYLAEGGGFLAEVSTTGLFGDWSQPSEIVATPYEGPYPFRSNTEPGKVYMLADLVGGNPGIRAWETNDELSGEFTQNTDHDLTYLRHGSVAAVTQEQYDALLAL